MTNPNNNKKIFFSYAGVWLAAPWVLVLICSLVAVAAYLPTLNYPFVYDDIYSIPENQKLIELHLTDLWRLLTEPYNVASEFLPLRELSFWFDMKLFGLNPAGYRMHNITLYLLCLPFVYVVSIGVWRYFRPADVSGAPWAAAMVTALFALHPALVESVVFISGRKYLLPNLFSMICLWLAIAVKREHGLSAPHAAAALFAFLAVMLSKASYVSVAPVIAMLWVLFWREISAPHRRRSQLLWPLSIMFLAIIMLNIFISYSVERDSAYFGIEVVPRTLAILGWFARLAISPESRHFFYPVFEDPYFPVMVALGGAVLAAALIGAMVLLRKKSLEGFSLVVFLLFCLPYMQLIPYAPPSLVQDHFISLAVWPATLLVVALAWRFKSAIRAILLIVFAVAWGAQTIERPRDWSSFDALIQNDSRAFPELYVPAIYKIKTILVPNGLFREAFATANNVTSPEARNILIKLIQCYAETSNSFSTGKPQEAMAHLLELSDDLKQVPEEAKWNNPLLYFWGVSQGMLADLIKALADNFPGDVLVQYKAGSWMLLYGNYEYATAHLRAAVESPRLPESMRGTAFKNFGLALLKNGHIAEAESPLLAALEQSPPDFQAYCLLSGLYKRTGRLEDAAHAEAGCYRYVPKDNQPI